MPFTVSKDVVHAALDEMSEHDWHHYDFRCPQCKKANRVSKEQLFHAAPTWREEEEE
jgi:transposase-like protein